MTNQRRAFQGSAAGGGGGVSSLHVVAPDQYSRQWTEDDIRRSLDGTLTRIDYEKKRTITVLVGESYVPAHNAVGIPIGSRHKKVRWDEADDLIALELNRRHMLTRDIAEKLGRTEDSVNARLRRLLGQKK